MKKMLFACAVVTLSLMALTSCAAEPTPSSSSAPTTTTLACLLSEVSGVNDKGFNQSAWEGLQAAAKADPTIAIKYITAASNNDYVNGIDALIGQSCGLIITVGFTMGDATYAAAQAHPDLKFAIVDQTFETPLPNLSSVVFDVGQAAYLGGYAAAALDPKGAVGMSGGLKIPPVTLYLDGVAGGVAHYNDKNSSKVRVLGWNVQSQEGTFVGSFTDQAQAQSIAQAFLSQGATVLIGGGGLLVPATAQTLQKNGSGSMLWADVDGCVTAAEYCGVIIGSMVKGVGPSVGRIAGSFATGQSLPATYVGTLANGGVGFILNSKFVGKLPSGLQSDLDAVAKGIEDGSIVVDSPSTPK